MWHKERDRILDASRRLHAENKRLQAEVERLQIDRAEYVASMATSHMVGRSEERVKIADWLDQTAHHHLARRVRDGAHDIQRIDVE